MTPELDIRRALVVASNSFTGAHIVQHLLQHTAAQVLGVSRSAEYPACFLPYLYRQPRRPERFAFRQLDVNAEMDRLVALCDEFEPDVVVNLAAQGEVRNSWKWPEQWYQTNCLGVVRLAEGLKEKKYLRRYVAISTPEVYGSTGENIVESHTYYPSTPYAASKLAGDLHLFTLFKRYGFPVVFTRSANVYGIHQQLYRIIPRAFIYLKLGRPIELHGGGLSRRAFVHIRDVAAAVHRAIVAGRNGEVYHVAPQGEVFSIREVVEMICRQCGADPAAALRVTAENFGQDAVFSLDASKARRELDWQTRVPFAAGLAETRAWIDENWEFLQTQPLDYVHKV